MILKIENPSQYSYTVKKIHDTIQNTIQNTTQNACKIIWCKCRSVNCPRNSVFGSRREMSSVQVAAEIGLPGECHSRKWNAGTVNQKMPDKLKLFIYVSVCLWIHHFFFINVVVSLLFILVLIALLYYAMNNITKKINKGIRSMRRHWKK